MDLLSTPLAEHVSQDQEVPRAERTASLSVDHTTRFRLPEERNYEKQYSHIYFVRLASAKKAIRARAVEKWSKLSAPVIDDILNIKPGKECIIYGTVYKEMPMKPNILDEYQAREQYEAPPPERSKYTSDEDEIILEDQTGRVVLVGEPLRKGSLVTGVIMAVLGFENSGGDFEVKDVCFLGLGLQKPLSPLPSSDTYVCLVSGLNISAKNTNRASLQLFSDYLTGCLGSYDDQSTAANIAHVIIAGNLIGPTSKGEDDVAQYKKRNMIPVTVDHMKEADLFIYQLASTISVDFMPGPHDPSNTIMPQQPLHSSMFPLSRKLTSVRGCTNPYEAMIEGRDFLGTSGQGVDDVFRFSESEDRLEILEHILEWGHIFPTAPDTLGSFPFDSKTGGFKDPFYTDKAPHICFAGNQPAFATSVLKGTNNQEVRVVCVPTFSETSTAVIVNLSTLECTPISFNV